MKYIIIGGVAGGATAATRIRRNTEKAEISVDGGHKVVLSLPRFMSSHFSNVVGSRHDLNVLADGYNSLFKEIGSVVNPVNTSGVNNQDINIKFKKGYEL